MNRFSQVVSFLTVAAIGSWGAATSSAAPISTAAFGAASGSEATPFPVSSVDIGQTNGTWSVVSGTFGTGTSVTKLNNGNKYGGFSTAASDDSLMPFNGMVAQLTFGSLVDIDSIVSVTGNLDDRTGQAYTVHSSTDGVSFSSLLHTVGGEANNSDAAGVETQVTIVDSSAGALATGVKALRFTFSNVGSTGESLYREIDVFGAVAVPEPSGLAICGMAGLALPFVARRRRRLQA